MQATLTQLWIPQPYLLLAFECEALGTGSIGQAIAWRVSAGRVLLEGFRKENADAAVKTRSS
jgi:hypothetical protein